MHTQVRRDDAGGSPATPRRVARAVLTTAAVAVFWLLVLLPLLSGTR
ncbi:hypothetical protein [Planomonospora venezuelensis]|uniref:Uncharacterized protein n=1 Tax=Planomonospora venezuelensis TaxID=1999 RepID=A0A841DJ92_PLAVE|nr:hypothetical protein [Planomonospora venezuelensis]MBB5967206.1 hypothetical protein [Planomonospora venezuelensis]